MEWREAGFGVSACRRWISLAAACSSFLCVFAHALPAVAANATATFTYTGGEQTFTVPGGVHSVSVLAIGGAGGAAAAQGGVGAEVIGELSVTPGEVLFVEVGGSGEFGLGGFNGGGRAGELMSGGGGGASDVRTNPLSEGLSPDPRLLVAGGGGGGGDQLSPGIAGAGGAAGEAGEDGHDGELGTIDEGAAGQPGTQTHGGAAGTVSGDVGNCKPGTAGQLGMGGEGASCGHSRGESATGEGGGGGGGYFGGGGGGDRGSFFAGRGGGGGGGSSLVPPGGTAELASAGAEPQVQITYLKLPVPVNTVSAPYSVARKTALARGTVDPEGSTISSCRFEYGLTRFLGSNAACHVRKSGSTPVAVSAALQGLTPGTSYHYRVVATNAAGTGYSSEETFRTVPVRPMITDEHAAAITEADAVLSGTVNLERGSLTACRIEYGSSYLYGASVPCTTGPGGEAGSLTASAVIDGLAAGTSYHFRVVASNSGATRDGADQRFATLPVPAATFTYTGSEQLYTVPAHVHQIGVVAVGGQGGAAAEGTEPGGIGAQVTGKLAVTPRETLYVEVAGNGEPGLGGFNGGGARGERFTQPGGGGGASDVRTAALAAGLEPDTRLLVAGGGGGAGLDGGAGGNAGAAGAEGYDLLGPYDERNPVTGGSAGTQSEGGAGGSDERGPVGAPGVRGTGGAGADSNDGGGGGGGLFGGGGGGGSLFGGGAGGGGGSSLVPSGGSVELASPATQPQVLIYTVK